MAESNSNSEPPLCPCGFWGSSQTNGLCSKCYKEMNEQEANSASNHANNATSGTLTSAICAQVKDAESLVTTSALSDSTQPQKSDENAGVQSLDITITSTVAPTAEAAGTETKAAAETGQAVQKNKKRCFKCKTRLELAFVEIGRCKCDYVFCEVHRLPEQHECLYDHKEQGRKEARDKMISPKKHVGTTLKRLDSDA